ncbi:hypothetical protein ANO11243_095170 [Dothideomycetidae sp. 11243]|nr:hypothetical protein ANO11243_095170 [fungal sp. No.11243]
MMGCDAVRETESDGVGEQREREREGRRRSSGGVTLLLELLLRQGGVRLTLTSSHVTPKNAVVVRVSAPRVLRAIFFDGFLPSSKKNERVSRLQQSIDALRQLRANHDDKQFGHLQEPVEHPFDVHTKIPPPSKTKAITPLGFVSAIFQFLLRSRFALATSVVPGEADLFCAQSAQTQPAFVFTGDSDLLVHSLGLQGVVAFFKDVTFFVRNGISQLTFLKFHPKEIADKLRLPDLFAMAYHVNKDIHRSIPDAAALAKKEEPNLREYREFKRLYVSATETEFVSSLKSLGCNEITGICYGMDTRITELVFQLRVMGQSDNTSQEGRRLYIFLPILIDNPRRASAHQPSAPIRHILYSILQVIDPSVSSVSEYDRKGTSIAPSIITLEMVDGTVQRLIELAQWIDGAQQSYKVLPPAARWRALAVVIVLDSKREAEKKLQSPSSARALILNDKEILLSWDMLHFKAEIQGALHCLSLMKQALIFISRLELWLALEAEKLAALEQLRSALQSLPPIAELYDYVDSTKAMATSDTLEIGVELDCLGTTGRGLGKIEKRKAKKRKGAALVKQMIENHAGRPGSNLFDALTEMNE